MENTKEKKIVQSIVKLQENLFKYKAFCKSLPDNITKDQKEELILMSAENLLLVQKQEEQIMRLCRSLDKTLFSNEAILQISMVNNMADSLFEYIKQKNKDKGSCDDEHRQ